MSSMKLRDTPARIRRNLSHSESLPSVPEREEEQIEEEIASSTSNPTTSSSEYHSHADREEATRGKQHGTPRGRKLGSSSVVTDQKGRARNADPNDGRCLITGRGPGGAVQTCHIVAQATSRKELTQLEYAWGVPRSRKFNVDTRRNLVFLRADWHILFDKDQWMLIPEESVLRTMLKYTQEIVPRDLSATFKSEAATFKYHFLPMKEMEEPICRFDGNGHKTFYHPFVNLGVLTSHIQPHYVVFNTAKKLLNAGAPAIYELPKRLYRIANPQPDPQPGSQPDPEIDPRTALIVGLYSTWMTAQPPKPIRPPEQLSGPSRSPSDQADKPDEGRRQLRSRRGANSSQQNTSEGNSQAGAGQQRAHVVDVDIGEGSDITVESTMDDEEWNSSEETAWIEEISQWEDKGSKEATSVGGWESAVLNDDQVAKYRDETVSALSTADWRDWQPSWLAVRRVLY